MDFVAIDFEKATSAPESICQIGMVRFRDGELVETFRSLVFQPKFDWYGTKHIHGIKAKHVSNAPKVPDAYDVVAEWLRDQTVVCHSKEERRSLTAIQRLHGLEPIACRWVDTVKVSEKVWPDLRDQKVGYGLVKLTEHFGISHDHHDAASDAMATGLLLVKAIQDSGATLESFAFMGMQQIAKDDEAAAKKALRVLRRRRMMKVRRRAKEAERQLRDGPP